MDEIEALTDIYGAARLLAIHDFAQDQREGGPCCVELLILLDKMVAFESRDEISTIMAREGIRFPEAIERLSALKQPQPGYANDD